jgi:hypothetical protein
VLTITVAAEKAPTIRRILDLWLELERNIGTKRARDIMVALLRIGDTLA